MIYVSRLGYCAPVPVAIRNSLSLGAFQCRFRRHAIRATLSLCLITVAASAQTATEATTTIQSSVEAATLGQAVKFTATVSPASATGTVTFFDGVNILGIEPLSDGQAILTTSLLTAGTHSITALYGGNRSDTAAVSAPLSLIVHVLPDLGFQAVQTSLARLDNSRIAVGDFNLDGIPDLAVMDVLFGGQPSLALASLTVLLGNGDGTFRTTAQLSQNVYTTMTPAIADFNGDGITDIATFTGIYLGNGDGTFQSPLASPVSNFNGNLVSLIAADFNGDGRADVAWSGFIDGSLAGVVGVVPGNGDGTFQSTLNVSLTSGGVLALGDFNADGRADLAMLSGPGQPSSATILLGKGDGTFQTPSVYTNSAASSIAVADFNGDGRDDLALGGSTTASILLSNPDGTFQAVLNSSISGTVAGIAAGDFNGDGHTDLAALYSSGQSTESILLLYGNGDGTLQGPVPESTPPLEQAIIAADFNDDGRTDLASFFDDDTSAGVSILLGQTAAQGPVAITKVLNAASFTAPIEAGSWVTIQGTDLAKDTRLWQSSDFNGNNLPTQLDGTSATIDGIPAYVEYISPTQINVLAPADTTTGSVNVVVTNNGQSSASATAQLQTYAPALFMTPQSNAIASELPNYTPVTSTAPAQAGDLVVLWCTGLGPTSPVAPVGAIVSGAPATATLPIVTIGGTQARAISSVMTSGTAGLYQITVQLPANAPTGTPVVQASIGGVQTQSGVTLFVGGQ
jgi:uncharacterized protein (TIGR03437 family)